MIDAPTAEVEDAIRPGGLAPTKAPRLQQLLAAVKERQPNFDLDLLETMPLPEAKQWLRALPGVGPKTAACVLLFGLTVMVLARLADATLSRFRSRS